MEEMQKFVWNKLCPNAFRVPAKIVGISYSGLMLSLFLTQTAICRERPLKIADNSVVTMHYTLTDNDGNVIDTSDGRDPLKYLHGAGNIIPGLEKELVGCVKGDAKQVTVQPAEGYGEVEPGLIQTLPHEAFTGVDEVKVGMEFQAQGPNGQAQYVVVKEVGDEGITIDANHALAGMVLNFDVKIEDVREASQEELDHGHVH